MRRLPACASVALLSLLIGVSADRAAYGAVDFFWPDPDIPAPKIEGARLVTDERYATVEEAVETSIGCFGPWPEARDSRPRQGRVGK